MKPDIFKPKLVVYASLLLLIFSVFSCFVELRFSIPDDRWMVLNNKFVNESEFSIAYFFGVFTQFNDIQYSPLNTLYYACIYLIDGYNPFFFHLFSIIFHLVNSILLFLIFERYLLKGFSIYTIFTATLLWAIHPLNVETVVWISASKIVLSTTCLLTLLLIVLKAKREKKDVIIIIISFLCACLIKEQSIMFAPIIVAIDLFYHKKAPFNPISIIEYSLYLLIMGVFIAVTLTANIESMQKVEYSLVERMCLMFYSIFWYMINTFLPVNLHYHYPFPIKPGESIPIQYYFYIILGLSCLYYTIKNKLYTNVNFFLLICALISMMLCLHIIPMSRRNIYADRYMYQPLIFFIPLIIKTFESHFKNNKMSVALSYCYLVYFIIYSAKLVMNWTSLNLNS